MSGWNWKMNGAVNAMDGFHKMEKDHDPVNSPSHYTAYKGLEIIDLTEQMNFNRGNAVKYIARAGHKSTGPGEIEDLKKAAWYIQREIERLLTVHPEDQVEVGEKLDSFVDEMKQYGKKTVGSDDFVVVYNYTCGCSWSNNSGGKPPTYCLSHPAASVIIPINKG